VDCRNSSPNDRLYPFRRRHGNGDQMNPHQREASTLDPSGAAHACKNYRYARLAGVANPSVNVFQRLDKRSDLWRNATGNGYEDWLAASELDQLKLLFQRRHLLAHTDGIVDEKSLNNSGDSTYRVGQRIIATTDDVVTMATLTAKLGDAIRRVT